MALSLIATAGASDANAYDTATNADTYFEAHPDYETWDKLFTATKERYLIFATTHIDMETIDGDKYDTSTTSGAAAQALRFPRAEDVDGSIFVPQAVKNAMFEQALSIAKKGTSNARQDAQNDGVTSVTIGDVSETYGSGAAASSELCDRARAILLNAGFLKVTSGWA